MKVILHKRYEAGNPSKDGKSTLPFNGTDRLRAADYLELPAAIAVRKWIEASSCDLTHSR
jgi:hypothetical protein